MLKKLAILIVVVIAGVLGYASTKPDSLHVERTAVISAPPTTVFALINDFREWPKWSPWEQLDPEMKRTLSGAPAGPGSVYEWEGNSDVGKGRMEITGASEPTNVNIKLDFLEPYEGHNTTTFTLQPSADQTAVRWTMDGPSPYMMKVMSVFMNMDKMIGDDFEKGLANLKATAERTN
jgi:hypothetical protein